MAGNRTPVSLVGGNRDGNNRALECHDNARKLLDFQQINALALSRLPDLLTRWLPDGKRQGHEWVARNPRRSDNRPGSFAVNLITGKWADFACDAKGGDVVSLAAYLGGISQGEAARNLADMMGVRHG